MFTESEKMSSGIFGGATNGASAEEEVGALGVTSTAFRSVVQILSKRSTPLLLKDDVPQPRNLISNNPTQKSLMQYLGNPKGAASSGGSSSSDVTGAGAADSKKSFQNKNNLLSKMEAEEFALRAMAAILADAKASADNPLCDDATAKPEPNVWSKLTEKNLEYLFKEAVTIEVAHGSSICQGRLFVKNEVGNDPFLLTVRMNVRILQRMLINFPWFINRLFRVISSLRVETKASGSGLTFSDSASGNATWMDMNVKHCIRDTDNIGAALKFLSKEYRVAYDGVNKSGSTPSYFFVEFELVDNNIGMVESDREHQGSAYMEWKCFPSRKNGAADTIFSSGAPESGDASTASLYSRLDNVRVGGNQFTVTSAAGPTMSYGPSIFDGGNDGSKGVVAAVCSGDWMDDIFADTCVQVGGGGNGGGGGGGGGYTYEKFRAGETTVTVAQNTPIVLMSMPKGNENKQLMVAMINFIDKTLNNIEKPNMCTEHDILGDDQAELYSSYKDMFLVAICSNPVHLYRVVCDLFVNLILPRLRNPLQKNIETSTQIGVGNNGSVRSKLVIEYGMDMQYDTPPYAKGKVRVGGRCACRRLCKEIRCFDARRQANANPKYKAPASTEQSWQRNHNIHRNSEHDFRFAGKLTALSDKSKKNEIMKNCFLSMDQTAFDQLNKCFQSASLHHIFCTDVLVLHRGNSFNINMENNKLKGFTELGGVEEENSSQKVNVKEALKSITNNKLKKGGKGGDILSHSSNSSLSYREFSDKVSRLVKDINALTNSMCVNCNKSEDLLYIIANIGIYMFNLLPLLELLLTFVDIEELKKPVRKCREITPENAVCKELLTVQGNLKRYMNLFKVVTIFLAKNYNAAVAAGINRRGYMSIVSNISGYRFQREGNIIRYHETISSVSSCVSFADYFSTRSSNDTGDGAGDDVENTIASMMGQFMDNKSDKKDNEKVFVDFYGRGLMDDDDSDDDIDNGIGNEVDEPSSAPTPIVAAETGGIKRSLEEEEEEEDYDAHAEEQPSKNLRTISVYKEDNAEEEGVF